MNESRFISNEVMLHFKCNCVDCGSILSLKASLRLNLRWGKLTGKSMRVHASLVKQSLDITPLEPIPAALSLQDNCLYVTKTDGHIISVTSSFIRLPNTAGMDTRELCTKIITSFVTEYCVELTSGLEHLNDSTHFYCEAFNELFLGSMPNGHCIIGCDEIFNWLEESANTLNSDYLFVGKGSRPLPQYRFFGNNVTNFPFAEYGFIGQRIGDRSSFNIPLILKPYSGCQSMNWWNGEPESMTLAANIIYQFTTLHRGAITYECPAVGDCQTFCEYFLSFAEFENINITQDTFYEFQELLKDC